MRVFAVIGTQRVPDELVPLIERLGALLGDRDFALRGQAGSLGNLMNRHFTGRIKCLFWPSQPDSGVHIYVNPKAGNLMPVMLKRVREYMAMSPTDKSVAMSVMASLYALEGPGVRDAEFAITYSTSTEENKVPLFLARKLGFKVFNIADKKELSELALCIKA